MEIIKIKDVQGKVNPRGVESKRIIENENTTVTCIKLKPGDVVPPHAVPVNVFFTVVEGKGTLKIGEDEAVVEANDVIVCPKNTKMSLEANQGEKFTVLNVKTPSLTKK